MSDSDSDVRAGAEASPPEIGSPAPGPSAHVHCEHARECPGCPAIARAPEEQREALRELTRSALARFPELAAIASHVEPVPAATPITGYRARAKLMVGGRRRGAAPRLGLYREGTHDVLDVPGCVVLAPSLADTATRLRELLRDPPREAEGALVPSDERGALEAIDLREVSFDGASRAMVTLVLDRERAPSEGAVRAAAESVRSACPRVASIAINLRGQGPQVLGAQTHVVLGPAELPDRIEEGAPYVLATHGSFVQAHRGTAAAMHAEVERELAALAPPGIAQVQIIELFAGSGALALRLAASGARVHAVESFAPAIELARRAAEAQRIAGLSIEVGDAAEALARVAARGDRADAIVLDPPRRGVRPELRTAIARVGPARVIYVACDPQTLARDLAHLARLGLVPSRVAPFDLMPLTAHVETLAVLVQGPVPVPRVVYQDELVIVVDKDPHEPTMPHLAHPTSTLARVRMLEGAADAVPVRPLDEGTSGLCLFARRPGDVARIAAGMMRESHVVLARGITPPKGVVKRELRDEGRARAASTSFVRRAVIGGHSLVRATPDRGHVDQVRRHLASIGHEVLGDERFGHAPSNRHLWERAALDRTFLHVERLELTIDGLPPRVLYARLPPDLALVIDRLGARDAPAPRRA